ncbi:receptor-type tyrosine-protein phosphatase eta [Pimephales promelas]|nr:receptor-type tyrosine-protein phosphatase eta [Pimephales promelas]
MSTVVCFHCAHSDPVWHSLVRTLRLAFPKAQFPLLLTHSESFRLYLHLTDPVPSLRVWNHALRFMVVLSTVIAPEQVLVMEQEGKTLLEKGAIEYVPRLQQGHRVGLGMGLGIRGWIWVGLGVGLEIRGWSWVLNGENNFTTATATTMYFLTESPTLAATTSPVTTSISSTDPQTSSETTSTTSTVTTTISSTDSQTPTPSTTPPATTSSTSTDSKPSTISSSTVTTTISSTDSQTPTPSTTPPATTSSTSTDSTPPTISSSTVTTTILSTASTSETPTLTPSTTPPATTSSTSTDSTPPTISSSTVTTTISSTSSTSETPTPTPSTTPPATTRSTSTDSTPPTISSSTVTTTISSTASTSETPTPTPSTTPPATTRSTSTDSTPPTISSSTVTTTISSTASTSETPTPTPSKTPPATTRSTLTDSTPPTISSSTVTTTISSTASTSETPTPTPSKTRPATTRSTLTDSTPPTISSSTVTTTISSTASTSETPTPTPSTTPPATTRSTSTDSTPPTISSSTVTTTISSTASTSETPTPTPSKTPPATTRSTLTDSTPPTISSSPVNSTISSPDSQTPTPTPTKPSHTGLIVGLVFGLICILLIITLLVFFYSRRQTKKQCPDIPLHNTSNCGIRIEDYEEYFKRKHADSNCGFAEEYEDLKSVGTAQSKNAALSIENKAKNRYTNVLPYDSSRVRLSMCGNPFDDYINANYIPGYNSRKEFIAAQGPLPVTVNEFWRMIWEKNVYSIVMLTRCNEQGRVKCEKYWPSETNHYHNISVTTTSDISLDSWTIRDFSIKNVKTAEIRNVRQFHFTAWPDHGVPETTEVLIDFRHLVREHMDQYSRNSPTVVHCSAGVGRTGTFIAIDRLIFQIERESMVDIFGIVNDMRMHRALMVQTEEQYVYLHQCAHDIIRSRTGTNVDLIYQNNEALNIYQNVKYLKL